MNRNFRDRYRSSHHRPNYDRNDGLPGVVYVLHNEAMRLGIYKIGQSTRSGNARANDLNQTVGTETPKLFKCIFEVKTVDCGRAEKAVHLRLQTHRMTRQEYFDVDLEFAKRVIEEECAKQGPVAAAKPAVSTSPPLRSPSVSINATTQIARTQNEQKSGISSGAIIFWILTAIVLYSFWPSKTIAPVKKMEHFGVPATQNSVPKPNPMPPSTVVPNPKAAQTTLPQTDLAKPQNKAQSNTSAAKVQTNGGDRSVDSNRLSPEEKSSLEAACSRDKYQNGPSAYNSCRAKQLAALGEGTPAPDMSRLSRDEKSSLESVCSRDKYQNGPSAYNSCRAKQLAALQR